MAEDASIANCMGDLIQFDTSAVHRDGAGLLCRILRLSCTCEGFVEERWTWPVPGMPRFCRLHSLALLRHPVSGQDNERGAKPQPQACKAQSKRTDDVVCPVAEAGCWCL